jgi:GNAT superfamily N-acetyltransferase
MTHRQERLEIRVTQRTTRYMRLDAFLPGEAPKRSAWNEVPDSAGFIELRLRPRQRIATVVFIYVFEEFRGRKVGQALWTAAANLTCQVWNVPLASDTVRVKEADAFWRKQAARGRAQRVDYGDRMTAARRHLDYYKLTCPAPASLDGTRKRR